jgi:hypothetical protein
MQKFKKTAPGEKPFHPCTLEAWLEKNNNDLRFETVMKSF